jgi:hypothetical protein
MHIGLVTIPHLSQAANDMLCRPAGSITRTAMLESLPEAMLTKAINNIIVGSAMYLFCVKAHTRPGEATGFMVPESWIQHHGLVHGSLQVNVASFGDHSNMLISTTPVHNT